MCMVSSSRQLHNVFPLGGVVASPSMSGIGRIVRGSPVSMRMSAPVSRITRVVRGCSLMTVPMLSDVKQLIKRVAISSMVSRMHRRSRHSCRLTSKLSRSMRASSGILHRAATHLP